LRPPRLLQPQIAAQKSSILGLVIAPNHGSRQLEGIRGTQIMPMKAALGKIATNSSAGSPANFCEAQCAAGSAPGFQPTRTQGTMALASQKPCIPFFPVYRNGIG
jgi:hypothetical protein